MGPARMETRFPALLEDDYQRIHRYILGLIRDPAEAEDLTQETFLRAHTHQDSLREERARRAWFYRIATNVTVDRLRQRSGHASLEPAIPSPDDAFIDRDAPTVEELAEREEMSECVQQYVADLPDSYRSALLLHDEHGLTALQIADLLGISVATAKIRLHRARQRLRAALEGGCAFSHDHRNVLVCERKS